VKKPDALPSILQWMEVPTDQSSNLNSSNSHTANNGTAQLDFRNMTLMSPAWV
jgi:hypothetical protein